MIQKKFLQKFIQLNQIPSKNFHYWPRREFFIEQPFYYTHFSRPRTQYYVIKNKPRTYEQYAENRTQEKQKTQNTKRDFFEDIHTQRNKQYEKEAAKQQAETDKLEKKNELRKRFYKKAFMSEFDDFFHKDFFNSFFGHRNEFRSVFRDMEKEFENFYQKYETEAEGQKGKNEKKLETESKTVKQTEAKQEAKEAKSEAKEVKSEAKEGKEQPKENSETKKQNESEYQSVYHYSNQTFRDFEGNVINQTKRNYEDATGRKKIWEERSINDKKVLKEVNNFEDGTKNEKLLGIEESKELEKFEELWKETIFGRKNLKEIGENKK